MTTIQTPAIGNALRKALSLDGAGPMGMESGLTVHPVVVVADVRAQLGTGIQSYANLRRIAAGGAGQYAKAGLECVPITATGLKVYKIVPRRAWLRSATAQTVFTNLGYSTPPAATTGPPKRLNSKINSNGAGRIIGGTDGVAPNIAFRVTMHQLVANVTYELNFNSEWTIEADPISPPSIVFECETANTDLDLSMEWDEYYNS